MDPNLEKYLDTLRTQREEVERRLRDREVKRKESNEIFVTSVKKEIEWLEKNKTKYELRNKKFLEEARNTIEEYKGELAKAYQADQALIVYRRKLDLFIQKNYPKLVTQLKARLFQDHNDISKKLKSMRDGSDMIKLNAEIRNLSEEINAKRYELIEEEEKRLRNEGSLQNYMYSSNPYSRSGGPKARHPESYEYSRDRIASPNQMGGSREEYLRAEDTRPPQATKIVSFGRDEDVLQKREIGKASQAQKSSSGMDLGGLSKGSPVREEDEYRNSSGQGSTSGLQKLNLGKFGKPEVKFVGAQNQPQTGGFKGGDLESDDFDDF